MRFFFPLRLSTLAGVGVTLFLASSTDAFQGTLVVGKVSSATTTQPSVRRQAIAVPLDSGSPTSPLLNENDDSASQLAPEDEWVGKLDYAAFGKEVSDLGKELLKDTGDDDVRHLEKIVQWRNIAAILGLATCWLPVNPIAVAALSTWTYSSWTMIAHHVCHGGYNRVDAGRFNSRGFGLGLVNRFVDWLDWMQPEAWNVEHNRLHHYRLNEGKDPDLVQRNLEFLSTNEKVPLFAKYAVVAFFLPVWKWFYYAPNTFKELKIQEYKREGKPLPKDFDSEEAVTVVSLFDPSRPAVREVVPPKELFGKVLGPMFMGRYMVIPALLLAIPGVGPTLAVHALGNLLLAELLTNVHAFVTIVTNHAGEDLYTFDDAVRPKSPSFYVRQIVGSVNYATGTDPIDFSHGWLNYQIEHHVWPDLSMLQYQKGAPKLKAICEKHGVPYVQESVFERLRKTVDIMVGNTKMRPFPTQFEPRGDKAKDVTWKSTNGSIDDE